MKSEFSRQVFGKKINIVRSILEQVRQFNYFGCELSLDGEPDFDTK